MDGVDLETSYTSALEAVSEGEWAGWTCYPGRDAFEDHSGPFYFKERDGRLVCAFRAEKKHMNGGGFMHGGCAMTFADFSLFVIARQAIGWAPAVTATFNAELVGTA